MGGVEGRRRVHFCPFTLKDKSGGGIEILGGSV